jgi:hypothetical protein
MKIEILYFPGCPNHGPTVQRVREVIARDGIDAEICEIDVTGERTAEQLGFLGSPTVRVNGLDIEPASRSATYAGMSCRRYVGGIPSEEMIRAALQEVQGH